MKRHKMKFVMKYPNSIGQDSIYLFRNEFYEISLLAFDN